MVKKLADHAALGAAVSPAGPIQPVHQIGGGFEGNQLLRVGLNVNSHAVMTGDDTVLSRRETPVYNWDLSDEMGGLALYALLLLSGCRE